MAANLQIPSPCHEKWSEMTPVKHDCRHCAVCDMQIVDFTMKTDAEILGHLRRNRGKVCGRFRFDQLDRPLLAPRAVMRSGLTAVAASFAAVLAAQQPVESQALEPVSTEQLSILQSHNLLGSIKPYNFLEKESMRNISGKIIDSKSLEPISHCKVFIEGTTYRSYTDENGIFSIDIPLEKIDDLIPVLSVKLFGYKKKVVELTERVRLEDVAITPIRYKLKAKKEKRIVMGCPAF